MTDAKAMAVGGSAASSQAGRVKPIDVAFLLCLSATSLCMAALSLRMRLAVVAVLLFAAVGGAPRSAHYSRNRESLSQGLRIGVRARTDATPSIARVLRSVRSQPAPRHINADPPSYTVRPADYGADPTGIADSSAAFDAAVTALRARNTSGHTLEGLADLGGSLLDLEGGDYRLSRPVALGQGIANFAVAHGTLRAGPGFAGAFVLDIGTGTSGGALCDWCVDALALEDLFLDGGGVAGGLRLAGASGGTVGPDIYAVNFSTAGGVGIDIEGGHEIELTGAWVGVCFFHDWECRRAPATLGNSTGILLNGNDHVVRDVVVWAAFTGLRVLGAANVIESVHTWNADALACPGSAGIALGAHLNRVLAPYLDGAPLVLECAPGAQGSGCEYTTVSGGFFLGVGAQVVLLPPPEGAPAAPVTGLTITDNTFSSAAGNASVVVAGGATGGERLSTVVDVTVSGTASWQAAVGPRAVISLPPASGPWDADFSGLLLFNASQAAAPIRAVSVDAVCHSGPCGAPPYALAPTGPVVRIVPSTGDSGGVWALTVTVDQSVRSVPGN